ncbi:MAG: hypothetical protein HY690_12950 [Chloroflexi bacterium]|nr:hypothetical protein [Chloroflexota bacterium]
MRAVITLLMLGGGVLLAMASYFFLAAPLGQAVSPMYSNPRLPGAPALFVLGVMLTFLSAVAYELIPERASSLEALAQASRPSHERR